MVQRRLKTVGWTALCAALVVTLASPPSGLAGDRDKDKDDDDRKEESRIQIGFAIAPVPLKLKGNRALIGLGSYIVNAQGGCNDCHTNPQFADGGDPFQGQPKKVNAARYLAGGTAFGPFTSRNITPNSTGLPAGRTLTEFLQLMRTGIDFRQAHPQISPLLQVMPWPVYQDMTERDLKAIYAYLSAIPCVDNAAGTRCQ